MAKQKAKSSKVTEKALVDAARALTDPIIVFNQAWGEDTPGWLIDEIRAQRLLQVARGEKDLATDVEALAYVSNASLCGPLDHDMTNIYSYLFTRVMGDRAPAELRLESISDYQMSILRRLKSWLWNQRAKHRKSK
ncbi:MAG: hypothetical protein PHO67_07895 [Candidatus Omnitrophica bacterium]|nr:hypothetical protein [Candidatus Omnitrophota bacterium]